MRILYGVTGEGLGHAMRARVFARHLSESGHEVLVAASGRARTLLAEDFEVLGIEGFELVYGKGRLRRTASLLHNVSRAPKKLAHNLGPAFDAAVRFEPEVVLTDFDSFAHAVGRWLDVPVVSIDHHHVMDRFEHPRSVRARVGPGFATTRSVVRAKTPGCAHYLVTSFFAPDPLRAHAETTTLVGPVLRPEIANATRARSDHFVAYQTSSSDPGLLDALRDSPARFVVYGRGATPDEAAPNVTVRAFDEARFVEDLASSRGLVAQGGHTALAEAVVLGKPVLSFPLRHQGEQELNAAWLIELGLGRAARAPRAAVVREFVRWADAFAPRHRVGCANDAACAALDAILEKVA